ncbi:MAG: dihydroorotase [Bacteroidaceae bacterium]|nr:dihydroorotase [Bacteroidaceae bacterium]
MDVIYVSDGRIRRADIKIEGDTIARISDREELSSLQEVAATSLPLLLPGVIDEHIHSREPGMTHKGDLWSETRAAAAGGVTSVMDMPNVVPPTTSLETWQERMELGAQHAFVNYAFHFGATNTNADLLTQLDVTRIPSVKLFMGSSTGGMLVNREEALQKVFASSPLPIMTHCEDTAMINANMRAIQTQHGDDPDIAFHPLIRSREACIASTRLAVRLAESTGARLHIAHITTAEELAIISGKSGLSGKSGKSGKSAASLPSITAEACIPHLIFTDEDYLTLGTRIKCNPAVKSATDREALRAALSDGRILTIATDHAPHLLSEKQGGSRTAVSGMPMVQFSLVAMMELVSDGILTLPRLVELMCHNPARLFEVRDRGFIREGQKADIVMLKPSVWTLTKDQIVSRCGWSPLEGRTFRWQVAETIVNGTAVYRDGHFLTDTNSHATALRFR